MKPHPIVASLAARSRDLDIPWGQLADAISGAASSPSAPTSRPASLSSAPAWG
jgi:hypothetical protein